MSALESDKIDQALFGYADGHRQIASSIRLPNRDLFQLSSASDLASGTALRAGESYLTGFPLAESKRYALIRTWPALEMPRPGCVWSHVLIVDNRLLSTFADLSIFLGYFQEPHADNHDTYTKRIAVSDALPSQSDCASTAVIREILKAYYTMSVAVLSATAPSGEIEASILRVWSQQWPKLRIGFTFRTAITGERRRIEGTSYDVRVTSDILASASVNGLSIDERWLDLATKDALTPEVLGLRKFLWRYGRDVSSPRRNFSLLVCLYLETQDSISPEIVRKIFSSFPGIKDALVLKRDALGFNAAENSLLPALSLPDFLNYLAAAPDASLSVDDIRERLKLATPADFVPASSVLDANWDHLDRWSDVLLQRFIDIVSREDILHDELSPKVRSVILKSRHDLIDAEVAKSLSNDAVYDLVLMSGDNELVGRIALNIVDREFGYLADKILVAAPVSITNAAILRAAQGTLSKSWTRALSQNSSQLPIKTILESLKRMSELCAAISIFHFSPRELLTAAFWSSIEKKLEDDVKEDDRINAFAFLLIAGLVGSGAPNWELVFRCFPIIRMRMLHAQLPSEAYDCLNGELPRFRSAQNWDLNKRFILTIAQLNRRDPISGNLSELKFSDDDIDVFRGGLQEEEKRSSSWFWW